MNVVPVEVLLTVDDVLERLRIGRTKLHEYVRDGSIQAVKFGRCTRFRADAIQRFIERCQTAPECRATATIRGLT